ncbi:MAG TPA: hypothetical protein VEP30_03925 [Chthoniobacterales bacterium]|nr:hypothetical protein [Chthoniobacterales bacterium]
MKPSSEANDYRTNFRSRRRTLFPITDCNFQAFALDRYHGGSPGSPVASFLNISREYFRYEARRNFRAEVAFFLIIAAILAVTFVSDARAIIHFLHLPAA